MTYIITFTLAVAFLGALTAWSRRSLLPRYTAVAVMLALIVACPLIMWELLGKPKEVSSEWRKPKDVEVIYSLAVEGEALYLLLMHPNFPEPRYYMLPWEKGGEEMKKGIDQHGHKAPGERVIIPNMFDPSTVEDRQPYPPPPKKMPTKVRQF